MVALYFDISLDPIFESFINGKSFTWNFMNILRMITSELEKEKREREKKGFRKKTKGIHNCENVNNGDLMKKLND